MMDEEEQQGPTLGEFDPSWMQDGGGISGGEATEPRFDDYNNFQETAFTQYYPNEDAWRRSAPRRRRDPGSRRQWNTTVVSRQNQLPDGGCI